MGLTAIVVDVAQASSSSVALSQGRGATRRLPGGLALGDAFKGLRKREYAQGLQCRVRREGGCASEARVWKVRCSSDSAGSLGGDLPASQPQQSEVSGIRDPAAASAASFAPLPQRIALFYDAFWRFLRPHTIRGTFLGTSALVTRALLENPTLINWALLPKALRGLLALLCGNGFIVGINQIFDSGIDKVNKPFLPIAAGDLSVPAAWALVGGLAALGVGLVATNFGPLITTLYTFGLFLGTIYSVPPLRLKQYPVPAFMIIATVRGFLLNFGVYYATRAALGLSYEWSPSVMFITIFVTLFATVIAITKDLPDIEGDKKFNISTFATNLGVRKISFLGAGLLLVNYIGAIVAAFYLPQAFKTKIMVTGHAVLGLSLIYQTWLLDTAKYSKEAISNFYRFIWNLFYSEYALFPFI
ncbi:probable homogentisate phytyltransferase 2, chloroplastic [Physcomitrium patens]|uniref:Uncharacterized protein n=1 Tax=Physcomitrium patens TaxID=3218 RepID=A9SCS8_PHYPA|nr:probable homogentisate phytyltransferase 2, chloroplastic [Physcomitrium patens]PNR39869.1 hypothetical protein PHYPA_020149 [Physcomitrium patens]|eukprot:XP_024397419.1 probable homogentisate phytyltransferase 2, chloroplastic [Physcomitrella patens]